jgi:hypothetical protein
MSRERLKRMNLYRLKPLLFALLTALAVASVCGAATTSTQRYPQNYANAYTAHAIRDHKVDPHLSPAARARAQRDAAIKKKKDLQNYIQSLAEASGKGASK